MGITKLLLIHAVRSFIYLFFILLLHLKRSSSPVGDLDHGSTLCHFLRRHLNVLLHFLAAFAILLLERAEDVAGLDGLGGLSGVIAKILSFGLA